MAAQNDLIRQHALGDFRELLHGMCKDVAMLIWLDGNANRKRQPNENFARELMELFSLGEGNYSETDITEAARAFSGWHIRHGEFWYNRLQHDHGTKRVLGRTGDLDGGDIVDLCLKQPACPRFLAQKLLREFVGPAGGRAATEQLAGRIRYHDFQLTLVLRDLFRSQLFFARDVRHTIIKSPVRFVLGTYRTLRVPANLQTTASLLAELGQNLFEPPTVKGWDGGRLWITSASILQRDRFVADLCFGAKYGALPDPPKSLGVPIDASTSDIVRLTSERLLARAVRPEVHDRLVQYLEQPVGDRHYRLRGLIHLIMTMPEYQLG